MTTTEYKPRKRNNVLGTCPLCNRVNVILVKHHWFTDDTHTIGFIRSICHTCNSILKTDNGNNNHVFTDWETQQSIVKKHLSPHSYKLSKAKLKIYTELNKKGIPATKQNAKTIKCAYNMNNKIKHTAEGLLEYIRGI